MSLLRHVTCLGATAAFVAALAVTGCGNAPRLAGGLGANAMGARSAAYNGVRWVPRQPVRALTAPLPESPLTATEDDDAADAPAAPAAGGGGLKPLPKPTPIPGPKAPAGPRAKDDVDALLTVLQNYGYEKNRKLMIRELQTKLFSYPVNRPETPMGWDRELDPAKQQPSEIHYSWWKTTLKEEVGSYNDYLQQSLLLAQNKFDVVYYVWLSKQEDPEQMKREGRTSLFVDLNQGLPVVKGIAGGGWLVEISPRGTIQDYLKIPSEYLRDLNHLVKIPEDLYF